MKRSDKLAQALVGDLRYDVVIVRMQDSRVIAMPGEHLSHERAEVRENTLVGRTNLDAYYVTTVPHGTYKIGDTVEEQP